MYESKANPGRKSCCVCQRTTEELGLNKTFAALGRSDIYGSCRVRELGAWQRAMPFEQV